MSGNPNFPLSDICTKISKSDLLPSQSNAGPFCTHLGYPRCLWVRFLLFSSEPIAYAPATTFMYLPMTNKPVRRQEMPGVLLRGLELFPWLLCVCVYVDENRFVITQTVKSFKDLNFSHKCNSSLCEEILKLEEPVKKNHKPFYQSETPLLLISCYLFIYSLVFYTSSSAHSAYIKHILNSKYESFFSNLS